MIQRVLHDNGVVTWQSTLLRSAGVPHGFSTRIGGVSTGTFASLNLGHAGGQEAPDSDDHVRENYLRLEAALAGGRKMLRAWVKQVHGVRVVQIEAEPEAEYAESLEAMIADRFHGQIEADGVLTDIPGLFVGVRVADCVPILMADNTGRLVAAVHAGWRGVVGNIVARAVRAFAESSIPPTELRVAIGPHISAPHFEVGPEVAAAFAEADLAAAVRHDLGPKPHVDLQAALKLQLARLNVQHVDETDQCTVQNAADFYSHRRDRGVTGRMAALIAPRPPAP